MSVTDTFYISKSVDHFTQFPSYFSKLKVLQSTYLLKVEKIKWEICYVAEGHNSPRNFATKISNSNK